MIKIKNLKLGYDHRFSLSVDYLSIPEDKVFTIIGPNGAGKTTLLNVIAMFERPQAGEIQVMGKDILNGKEALSLRRKMSVIFSRPYLLNETVYNNIRLPLLLRGADDKESIDNICDFFKIAHLKNSNAKKLSQGEMHRVSLARAFITDPKLVLMDEPFSSLDPRYKEALINDLRKIIKLKKTTVVFVTQDHFEALSLADELAVMKDGRIMQQGLPVEIFSRPSSKEVADFVGIETIVEGEIIKKEDNLCFVRIDDKIIEAVSDLSVGDHVFVCIRPEDVIISLHADATSARNRFKAKIIKIEPWMLEYKLLLEADFNMVSFITKQSIESLNLKPQKEVFVSFKATAIHLIKR
jgi:tungstate transport system ATP-binding protein